MEKIKIELSVEEANAILAALGQQPYLKVVDLIQKIQGQGAAQLQKASPTEAVHSENDQTGRLTKDKNGK